MEKEKRFNSKTITQELHKQFQEEDAKIIKNSEVEIDKISEWNWDSPVLFTISYNDFLVMKFAKDDYAIVFANIEAFNSKEEKYALFLIKLSQNLKNEKLKQEIKDQIESREYKSNISISLDDNGIYFEINVQDFPIMEECKDIDNSNNDLLILSYKKKYYDFIFKIMAIVIGNLFNLDNSNLLNRLLMPAKKTCLEGGIISEIILSTHSQK